jgi:branched-chain amino acid transport system substrate-binding protein
MEKSSTTMMAVLLVVGLVVGAGAGYILGPTKIEVETKTITVEKHPLEGKTVTFGYIAMGPGDLEFNQLFVEDLIAEDIKAYVDSLGIDVTFEWQYKDAGGTDRIHLTKVEELHSQGVDIFIGGPWSDMAEYALDYVNENGMLMVSETSTWLNVEIEDDNLFRFASVDLVQVEALAHMMMSWGIEHVFVLDDAYYERSREEDWYETFEETYESLGGEIIGKSMYDIDMRELHNDIVGTFLVDAIEAYGEDRVGVAAFIEHHSHVFRDAAQAEHLGNVTWMSLAEGQIPESIFPTSPGGPQIKLRMFTPIQSTSTSSRWSEFEADFESVMGESPTIWDGITYDAVWCLVLSVLQAGSADPMKVKEVLPGVAENYYGVSGGCALNSAGDREPHVYDIWGYAQVEDEHNYIKYGEYDAKTDEVQWFDSALSSQNLTRPGS